MYCKIYGIANGAILKKKKVCKILVELYSAILVRFSIFSIQVELICQQSSTVQVQYRYRTGTRTVSHIILVWCRYIYIYWETPGDTSVQLRWNHTIGTVLSIQQLSALSTVRTIRSTEYCTGTRTVQVRSYGHCNIRGSPPSVCSELLDYSRLFAIPVSR